MVKKKNTEQAPLFAGLDLDDIHPVETITEDQAERYQFDTVDFSDPNRPKACLEVDFPILKVNEISAIEQNATKPIYMMSKWWARRRASVFRQLLISAATKAPADESKAAQTSWSLMYRKNHQKHGKFSKLNVVDIFMGGGTTVVEAARLGFTVTGIDINPIAWWVVKNETTPVDPQKFNQFAQYIESQVKPQIMAFYTANSPRGFKGKWFDVETKNEAKIDPYKIPLDHRKNYRWEGPETIYTFWMKHIMCSDPSCNHLTPQANSSIVATKAIKQKYLANCVCPSCGDVFDFEYGDFRMAPTAKFILGEGETPFATIGSDENKSICPHCKKTLGLEWVNKLEKQKEKKSKEVEHLLILDKEWLKGITGDSKDYFGGYFGATDDQDKKWFDERSKKLKLIEVRGKAPDDLLHSNYGKKAKVKKTESEDEERSSGSLICGKCGRQQDPLSSIKLTNRLAPVFPYMIQGFDPEAKERGFPYSGRFFDLPDFNQFLECLSFIKERSDLNEYIPRDELFYGFQTHHSQGGVPNHGYTHWYKMFNPRQLLVHSSLLKEIMKAPESEFDVHVKSQMLGAFQQYLRYNCMFTIWQASYDKLIPHFSNNNYYPKATTVENSVFSNVGAGNFNSCKDLVMNGLAFAKAPYDLKVNDQNKGGKSIKVESRDVVTNCNVNLYCGSSTDLKQTIGNSSVDLVVTDPPFGDNLNYSELADFFLVWLHKPISKFFPSVITSAESPKSLEAVANKARHPGETPEGFRKADIVYDRLLTLCWREAYRILKPGGLMTFTFHHDKDDAWINVLESLFKAGFLIESAFPIRSDVTKGDGDFGSKKIEFDIVHVCKKRFLDPAEIFWATLRKKILESVKSKSYLLAQHRASGLHLADLEVIIRGEVLEQYSNHYGKVKKNLAGDLMTVREILIEANNIAQSLLQSSLQDKVPDSVEAETKVFISLFRDGPKIEFNAARKRLKGSGTSLEELERYGWVLTSRVGKEKVSFVSNISERWNSLSRKKSFSSDLDQVHFAINCCIGGKQLDGIPADLESWIESQYKSLLPSVVPLLKFIEGNHFGADYKNAIGMAYRTIERTLNKIKESDGEFKKVSDQLNFFE